MVNATGWSELMDGDLVGASFAMYDAALAGWTIALLFIVYQFMLYRKTRNLVLCWITGIFFASLYIGGTILDNLVKSASVYVIFIILVLELAGILYFVIFK